MSSPLAGAWERVSDTDQGILVLTETHFSMVVMPKNRQRSERNEPTPEEAMAAYRDPGWSSDKTNLPRADGIGDRDRSRGRRYGCRSQTGGGAALANVGTSTISSVGSNRLPCARPKRMLYPHHLREDLRASCRFCSRFEGVRIVRRGALRTTHRTAMSRQC